MTAPKVSTIRRYCDNHLAIEILRERDIITDLEAEAMHARARRKEAVTYARIYDTAAARLYADVLAEVGADDHIIEAVTAATLERAS